MSRKFETPAIFLVIMMLPVTAQAYFGPGAGLGAIAAFLGVIGALLLGFFAIVYYPIKRALSKRKSKDSDQ